MKWIEPKHSKKQVRKAGEHLVSADLESDDFENSVPIFHNWRSAHAFPMQVMLDFLRKNALRIDKSAVAVQRLKRANSIFDKLFREKGMSLSRMEDIAGCRVVLSDVRYVFKLHQLLRKSRTKNILHRERDYLSAPKSSGYRGIHLVYRYNGQKVPFQGMAVELQLRSRIQHSWALARLEDCPVPEEYGDVDTFTEMDNLIKKLNLFERLGAFKVATKALTEGNVEINWMKQQNSIMSWKRNIKVIPKLIL